MKADQEWEKEEAVDDGDLKAGQIGIRVKFSGGKASLDMKGAGRSPKKPTKRQERDIKLKEEIKPKQKVVIHSKLPAIATKSVLAEDLYKVSMVLQFAVGYLVYNISKPTICPFKSFRQHQNTTVLGLN